MERLGVSLILVMFFSTTIFASIVPDSEKIYLNECAEVIGEACGKPLYEKVFGNNYNPTTNRCCYKLIQTGHYCHTKLILFALESDPELRNEDWIQILNKGEDIYQQCDQVTKPENPTFFTKCMEQIGYDCGEEVVNNLTRDETLSNQCCEKLVKMGKKCHINMVKSLLRTPEMKNFDPIHLLSKSKRTFDQCKNEE